MRKSATWIRNFIRKWRFYKNRNVIIKKLNKLKEGKHDDEEKKEEKEK
jgi:hypothetical protein